MKVYLKDEDKHYIGTFVGLFVLIILGVVSFFILKNIYNSYEEINVLVILSEHIEIYWVLFFIVIILLYIVSLFIKPVKIVTLTKKEHQTYKNEKIVYLTFETNQRHDAMIRQDYSTNLNSYAKESEERVGVYECFVYEDPGFEINKKYKMYLKRGVLAPKYIEEIIEEPSKEKAKPDQLLFPMIGAVIIFLGILISIICRMFINLKEGNIDIQSELPSLIVYGLVFVMVIVAFVRMLKDHKKITEINKLIKRDKDEK